MTATIIELSEDAFDAQYLLRRNHLDSAAGWDNGQGGCLFETYGEALALVRSQDPRTVWTLIDGDDGDQYVLSGFHLVNRIGYLISTVPVPDGTTFKVRIPMQSEEHAEAKAHTPEPWRIHRLNNGWPVIISDAHDIADLRLNGNGLPHVQANARRICAAVNACKGISTEALEHGVIAELLVALGQLVYDAGGNQNNPMIRDKTLTTIENARTTLAKTNRRAE